MPKTSHLVRNVILALVIIALGVFVYFQFGEELSSRESIINLVNNYGSLGPLVVILIIILEVILAPLPGGIIPIITGFLFGPWLGSIYCWVGDVIGSIIAFWLARKIGQPLIERFVSKTKQDFYNNFINKKNYIIWLLYIIPLFPIDIISMLIGVSRFKFKRFLLVMMIGFIPNVIILNALGYWLSDINLGDYSSLALLVTLVVFLGLIIWGVHSYLKSKKQA